MLLETHEDVVKYHGTEILTFSEGEEHYIAIKPLCEKFGIAWQPQHRKLNSDELFRSVITNMVTTGADGKQYEMTCISLKVFPIWLASINTGRVKNPDAASLILDFRREATQVLYEHFLGNRQYGKPSALKRNMRKQLARERLANYLASSTVWNEDTLKRLVELKKPLYMKELAALFGCHKDTVQKAMRLYRRAQGDFSEQRPDNFVPENEKADVTFLEMMSQKPITRQEKLDIWTMRAQDRLPYTQIAEVTGYSKTYCRQIANKVQLHKGAGYEIT